VNTVGQATKGAYAELQALVVTLTGYEAAKVAAGHARDAMISLDKLIYCIDSWGL
jgi:hypothetical protein